jgi:DNA-directed RNA polymerase subunit RPC12/RpoP
MPYPELDEISCRNCGHKLLIPKLIVDEKYVCPGCDHIIVIKIKIIDESFNTPDPRHLC